MLGSERGRCTEKGRGAFPAERTRHAPDTLHTWLAPEASPAQQTGLWFKGASAVSKEDAEE